MLDIGPNCKVELHFALRLADTGELVDSTFEKKPAKLVIGDGNLPEAFEAVIFGMKAGDKKVERIAPKDGFGQHNPSNVQKFLEINLIHLLNCPKAWLSAFRIKPNQSCLEWSQQLKNRW